VVENFEVEFFSCKEAESPCDQEIDLTLAQLMVQSVRFRDRDDMKYDSRIMLREPLDDCGNEGRGVNGAASDSHFSDRWVGEKLDVLHRLVQVVEYGRSAIEQRTTVGVSARRPGRCDRADSRPMHVPVPQSIWKRRAGSY